MIEETRRAFEEIRKSILIKHSMATMTGDTESIKNANTEFDMIEDILREIGYYMDELPPHRRQEDGTLDNQLSAKYVFRWKGHQYIYFRVRPRPMPPEGWHRFGPQCRPICGTNWRRMHFTCLRGCWGKHIWYGTMPPAFRFTKLSLIVRPGRPRWKKILTKFVCSVLEWLTS